MVVCPICVVGGPNGATCVPIMPPHHPTQPPWAGVHSPKSVVFKQCSHRHNHPGGHGNKHVLAVGAPVSVAPGFGCLGCPRGHTTGMPHTLWACVVHPQAACGAVGGWVAMVPTLGGHRCPPSDHRLPGAAQHTPQGAGWGACGTTAPPQGVWVLGVHGGASACRHTHCSAPLYK